MSHTPGPWRAYRGGRTGWLEVRCADNRGPTDIIRDPIEREANVTLMASSPRLLAALKWTQQYMPKEPQYREVLEMIRAAIKEAEGR
jgi:hypothetical protein